MGFEDIANMGKNVPATQQQAQEPEVRYVPMPADLRSGSPNAKEIREFDEIDFGALSKESPLDLQIFLTKYMKHLGWLNLDATMQTRIERKMRIILGFASGGGNAHIVHDLLVEFIVMCQAIKSRSDIPEIGVRGRLVYSFQKVAQDLTTRQGQIKEQPAGFVQGVIGGNK
jgi:hypothetical protein